MKYFKKEIGFIVALLFVLISCLPFDSASAVSSKVITKIEFKQAQQNLIAGSTGQLALVGTVSGKKSQSIKLPNKNIEISSSNKFITIKKNGQFIISKQTPTNTDIKIVAVVLTNNKKASTKIHIKKNSKEQAVTLIDYEKNYVVENNSDKQVNVDLDKGGDYASYNKKGQAANASLGTGKMASIHPNSKLFVSYDRANAKAPVVSGKKNSKVIIKKTATPAYIVAKLAPQASIQIKNTGKVAPFYFRVKSIESTVKLTEIHYNEANMMQKLTAKKEFKTSMNHIVALKQSTVVKNEGTEEVFVYTGKQLGDVQVNNIPNIKMIVVKPNETYSLTKVGSENDMATEDISVSNAKSFDTVVYDSDNSLKQIDPLHENKVFPVVADGETIIENSSKSNAMIYYTSEKIQAKRIEEKALKIVNIHPKETMNFTVENNAKNYLVGRYSSPFFMLTAQMENDVKTYDLKIYNEYNNPTSSFRNLTSKNILHSGITNGKKISSFDLQNTSNKSIQIYVPARSSFIKKVDGDIFNELTLKPGQAASLKLNESNIILEGNNSLYRFVEKNSEEQTALWSSIKKLAPNKQFTTYSSDEYLIDNKGKTNIKLSFLSGNIEYRLLTADEIAKFERQ